MNRRLAQKGALLFIITVFSKIATFVATIVFSHFFGTNQVTDSYYAAGTIPNLVNNSLTICALTLFIPMYTRCEREEGNNAANKFTANILNCFVFFNVVLFCLVTIFSPLLSQIVAPGFSEEGIVHTTRMISLLSMSFPFTVAVHVLNNLCNVKQKYVFSSLLTLFYQILVIIFNIGIAPFYGIYSYPFICTGVWVIQLIILYKYVSQKELFKYQFYIDIRDKNFKKMVKQSIPVMLATAADQINLAADNIISSDLPDGSLSCLGYSHRIFNSVNGMITATLLAIYYPIFSRFYAEKKWTELDANLKRYIDLMSLLTLPLTFFLAVNSKDIISLLFDHGAMKEEDLETISIIFTIYVCSLFFLSLKELATRLFYIVGSTRKPTVINVVCMVLNVLLSIILKGFFGVYGVAVATTVSVIVCAMLECFYLIKHIGGISQFRSHDIFNVVNFIQIIIASIFSVCLMFLGKSLMAYNYYILDIIFAASTFTVAFLISLFICKNQYLFMIIKKKGI